MAISLVGFGAAQGAITSITLSWPNHQANDIGVLVVETSGNNNYPATPSGWTLLGRQFDVSTTAGSRLSIFWRRATNASQGDATITDTGNHQVGRIFALRGCVTSGSPVNVSSFSSNAASTTVSVQEIQTTVANTYYAAIVSRPNDTSSTNQFGYPSNSNITVTANTESGTSVGNGGGFVICLGTFAGPGLTGITTLTQTTSTTNVTAAIAFEPPAPTVTTLTADAGSFTLSGQDAALSFTRAVISESGSFTTTGQAAALLQAKRLASEAGTFALTGQQAALRVSRRLTAQAGTFTLTDQSATLQATRSLTTQAGSFTLTGQSAVLARVRSITAQAGSFTLTGQSAVLVRTRGITAQAGNYMLTEYASNVWYRRNSLLIG